MDGWNGTHLPVSAMPTTSRPSSAGGHEQAWIGVGSLNPSKAARSCSGTSSWANERIGVTGEPLSGMWSVISFFLRKASMSEEDGGALDDEGALEGSEAELDASLLFFLSFLPVLHIPHESSSADFSCTDSGSKIEAPGDGSVMTSVIPLDLLFLSFFSFFSSFFSSV